MKGRSALVRRILQHGHHPHHQGLAALKELLAHVADHQAVSPGGHKDRVTDILVVLDEAWMLKA